MLADARGSERGDTGHVNAFKPGGIRVFGADERT